MVALLCIPSFALLPGPNTVLRHQTLTKVASAAPNAHYKHIAYSKYDAQRDGSSAYLAAARIPCRCALPPAALRTLAQLRCIFAARTPKKRKEP